MAGIKRRVSCMQLFQIFNIVMIVLHSDEERYEHILVFPLFAARPTHLLAFNRGFLYDIYVSV
jgi:hypothetical protein